jgi:hypothetical protein
MFETLVLILVFFAGIVLLTKLLGLVLGSLFWLLTLPVKIVFALLSLAAVLIWWPLKMFGAFLGLMLFALLLPVQFLALGLGVMGVIAAIILGLALPLLPVIALGVIVGLVLRHQNTVRVVR